jgi:hypothetical protein
LCAGARAAPPTPRRTIHTSLSVIDSLKVGVGAAEKHSMGHTPLPQRMTPRRVDG